MAGEQTSFADRIQTDSDFYQKWQSNILRTQIQVEKFSFHQVLYILFLTSTYCY